MSIDSPLLQPCILHGALQLRNRVVMAPLTRARAGVDRVPNAQMSQYYQQRSSAGLIIAEATVVSERGIGFVDSPGIYNEQQLHGWQQLVEDVHAKGGLIFLQLWHCGRASHSSFHKHAALPVAPSAVKLEGDHIHTPKGNQAYETPHALTVSEIEQTIENYKNAAKNARLAGFDGVEVHCANGYLLDQFLQSHTNQRTDDFGGSIEKRYRMVDEVIRAVMEEMPANKIGVRISPNGVFNNMGATDFRETFSYVAQQLNKYGLAYLHVMDGLSFGFHELGEPMLLAEFRALFSGPLMGNCGYDQASAEQAIENCTADLIAFGRPYMSNPDLVERFCNDWPLSPEAEIAYWYTPMQEGYTDFPDYQGG